MIVVSNFRSGDIAVGGCGAPLVPYFDRVLVEMIRNEVNRQGQSSIVVALQNLGGIGNVTLFSLGGDLVAFDTGPANVILNEFLEQLFRRTQQLESFANVCWKPLRSRLSSAQGRQESAGDNVTAWCDLDGFFSSRGRACESWLQEWWEFAGSYFEMPPPKSCGRELFGSSFVEAYVLPKLEALIETCESSPAEARATHAEALFNGVCDMCRTAIAFTAMTIHEAYKRHLPQYPDVVALSGGGASNPVLLRELQTRLGERWPDAKDHSSVLVSTLSDILGHKLTWRHKGEASSPLTVDDAKEALAFAVLAHEKLNELAGCFLGEGTNETAATGAQYPVVLGQISVPSHISR
jgi:anhydro-N-acetylmuramic acid kinase